MQLIFQRRPGQTALWLDSAPRPLALPEGRLLGLHLPAPAAASAIVVATDAGVARLEAPADGWVVLALPGRVLTLHAEGPPLRLSGGLGEGPEHPACRVWHDEGLIPEAHWRQARILGDGALLALAGGPARPCLRLKAGEWGRVTLPPLALPGPVRPVLAVLRGSLPAADLAGLTLTLTAGSDCEVVWEAVQLRPNSLANSDAPKRR
ncbi:hypothetical protein [Sediminicoccus sp. KRV36]|uniref:hypothetical protein n=1 Tax=Sediminicoccus sp. KRV36 TaxID=3133721 RepID=UPI00200DC5F9|nr:hypothetical protein [Sediminicoccus rosea]UPY34975.1 hypothetical protein LHU95_12090 [Sediminicoccus rosea]